MAWPFKKENPDNKPGKKFQSLGQSKFGAKKGSKKTPEEEKAEEVPEEEVSDLSDDLSDLEDLQESGAVESPFHNPPGNEPLPQGPDLDASSDIGIPIGDNLVDDLDDDVDEISLENDKDEEVIPSNQRLGTMRIAKPNLTPPPKNSGSEGSSKGPIPSLDALANAKQSLNSDQKELAKALIDGGSITHEELEQQLKEAGKFEGVLGKALLSTGYVKEEKLYPILLSKYRIPKLNIQNTKIPRNTLDLISSEMANRLRVVPIDKVGNIICVAMDNIHNSGALVEIRKLTGAKVAVIQCTPEGMELTLKRYYSEPSPAVSSQSSFSTPVAPAAPTAAAPLPQAVANVNRILALPANAQDFQGALPLNGRYLYVEALWNQIQVQGGKIVPEEAKL